MKRLNLFVILVFALVFPSFAIGSEWKIDPVHSNIHFTIRHQTIANVHGDFRKFEGLITADEENLENSKVEVTIEAASIDTGVEKRDEHLRTPDFFAVASFPHLTYVSKSIKRDDSGKYHITGDLTMRGTTREVVLEMDEPSAPIKDKAGNIRRGTTATTKLNRMDFGVSWNSLLEAGGLSVGEEVRIVIDVELVKQ